MSNERRILKEYVKSVLLEDEGYGAAYGDYSDSPYGMGMYSGGPSLYKIFVEPFVDVFKTAKATAEDLSARTRAAAKVAFEGIATSLIPGLSSDYKAIFDKERADLQKIKGKYKDVFERTDKALFNEGNDFVLLAFLLDPARFITATALNKAPGVVLSIFEILSGENLKLRSFFDKLKLIKHAPGQSKEPSGGYMGGQGYLEGRIYEDNGKQQDPNAQLKAKLSNPKVLAAVQNSAKAKAMKQDAMALVNQTVNDLLAKVKSVQSARTLDDLAKVAPGFDRSKLAALQKLPANERQAAEQAIVAQVKKAANEFYTKTLQSQIDSAMKAGVPADNPLLQGYKKVMGMIRLS
jgi:hypothetical protein